MHPTQWGVPCNGRMSAPRTLAVEHPMPLIALIRHGETDFNRERILQPPGTPLSALGRAQAAAVALRVAALKPAAIVASDLARAWETAAASVASTGIDPAPSALLHERNFGDWRGRPYTDFDFDPVHGGRVPPGGESAAQFEARVAQAWAWLVERRRACGGLLAVFTHGLVIGAILDRQVAGGRGADQPALLANTSVTLIEAQAPHRATLVGCATHLAGLGPTGGTAARAAGAA